MDSNQIFLVALANVPTMLTVLIGILLNNGRLNDLNTRMTSMEGRLNHMDSKLDSRFDVMIGKIEELDNRLTRIEGQLH